MNISEELKKHNAPGYHRVFRCPKNFNALIRKEGYNLNLQYVRFIESFGNGHFFGGALVLFPLLGDTGSIKTLTENLQNIGIVDFIVIGYAGTKEGYYCLKNNVNDNVVYWVNIQLKTVEILNESFNLWINSLPNQLFNADIYAAYKKIKDIGSINRVINERSLIEVEILDFEKILTTWKRK